MADITARRAQTGDYKDGAIQQIVLSNFMTHGHAVIDPGPRMNMVVGANGTGKSSILSAICLGLGGTPKLLGRADDVRAFVQNGQNVASISVTLAPGTHTIRRVIDIRKGSEKGKGRGSSTFYVNDEKTSVDVVKDLVQGTYNIQLDNLCTFLPQEKVGSFSSLSNTQRLLEAEKTLPDHLYQKHNDIIELQNALESQESDLNALEATLKKKKAELDRLEIDRGREEERLQAAAQLELLAAKRLWMEFEELRDQTIALKEKKNECKKELQVAIQLLEPLRLSHGDLASAQKKAGIRSKKAEDSIKTAFKSMDDKMKKFETHDDSQATSLSNLHEIDSERERAIEQHKTQLNKLNELESAMATQDPTEIVQRFEEAKRNYRALQKEQGDSKREHAKLRSTMQNCAEDVRRAEHKLNRMNDDEARRREHVFQGDPSLKKVYDFIQENQDRLEKRVYGPVAVEVTPASQLAAAQLEQHVSGSIWKSFVCESSRDRKFLYDEIRGKLNVGVNLLEIENLRAPSGRMYPDRVFQELQDKYGISGYLDQCYEAPDAIRIALEKFSKPSRVLVGNHKTLEALDRGFAQRLTELSNNNGSVVIASNENGQSYKFTQIVSQYSKKMSSREDQVGSARLLAPGVDESVKEAVRQELEEKQGALSNLQPQCTELGKKVTSLEEQAQELTLKAQHAKKVMQDLDKMKGKVERQRRKVEDAAEAIAVDSTAEQKKTLAKDIMKRVGLMVNALSSHGEHQDEFMEVTMENAVQRVQLVKLAHQELLAREELQEKEAATENLKTTAQLVEQEFKAKMKQLKGKKRQAEQEAPIVDDAGQDLPLKDQLESIDVSTVEECDAATDEAHANLQKYSANPEVIRQYERLKGEIADMNERFTNSAQDREGKNNGIAKKLESYAVPLENYVNKIKLKFGQYMGEMGCTGEVRLVKGGGDERNFKEWALEILVSFREGTKAQVLSADRHSGGERAVSTIMFLMALQDMMMAPFRSVDEINQGLDDRNERLVFKRIVENSTGPPKRGDLQDHSGQYFLITPKLLPGLTDMECEGVTVLLVYNGAHNFAQPSDWRSAMDKLHSGDITDENSENRVAKKRRES